jgi:hypothetical protein
MRAAVACSRVPECNLAVRRSHGPIMPSGHERRIHLVRAGRQRSSVPGSWPDGDSVLPARQGWSQVDRGFDGQPAGRAYVCIVGVTRSSGRRVTRCSFLARLNGLRVPRAPRRRVRLAVSRGRAAVGCLPVTPGWPCWSALYGRAGAGRTGGPGAPRGGIRAAPSRRRTARWTPGQRRRPRSARPSPWRR